MSSEAPVSNKARLVGGAILIAVAAAVVSCERLMEPGMARDAIRNVAGGAPIEDMVEARWSGRRSSLWCGQVGRPKNGVVAVTIRRGRALPLPWVAEVAPEWVTERNPTEERMLAACGVEPQARPL